MPVKPLLIGIAGGTGSGKTLVAQRILSEIGSERIAIIEQDSYYRNFADILETDDGIKNFDHPDSFDMELMRSNICSLMEGHPTEIPVYDYSNHTRSKIYRTIENNHVIILEGILTLFNQEIRSLMDIKVYIDTDADLRFIRRLKKDISERDRTVDSIVQQYEKTVRPMHIRFVEPTKAFADVIIPGGGQNEVALDLLKTKVRTLLEART